jgi:hypothetical protein
MERGYGIWNIDMVILDGDMGYGISIWEMTVSIRDMGYRYCYHGYRYGICCQSVPWRRAEMHALVLLAALAASFVFLASSATVVVGES